MVSSRAHVLLALLVPLTWGCDDKSTLEAPGSGDIRIRCQALEHLACTGLYGEDGEGWATKTVSPEVRPFEPGLQLWSDGLEKSRFIFLPPGTRVDTEQMDGWHFPPGTKLWKEFRWQGRRIETRFLWKQPDGLWQRTTYRWSEDERSAVELTAGARNVPGTNGYEIPRQEDCHTCHFGRGDGVLGFEAVALAHPAARGLTLERLAEEGLLTYPPATPPRVPGTPVEQEALGYLHINCGVACHNATPLALARTTGLHLRLEVAELGSVQDTAAWRTAVGVRSQFRPSSGGDYLRVAPGDSRGSMVHYRMSRRDLFFQMPPLGTHEVDARGLALIQRWIESIPAPP